MTNYGFDNMVELKLNVIPLYIWFCSRRQWTKEEDLARDLKLHTKQLRRTLRFFEEEKLVTRDHRKEVHSAGSALWAKSLTPFITVIL